MITDEMVEVAERTRYSACKLPYEKMRLGLEAVLPMIRAEVLEEAAKVAMNRDVGNGYYIEIREAIAEAIRAMKGTSHE
jgi:hypothetical protein